MRKILTAFVNEELGATSIEYGLIAALIFLAIIAGVRMVGENNTNSYNDTADKVSNAMN